MSFVCLLLKQYNIGVSSEKLILVKYKDGNICFNHYFCRKSVSLLLYL